MSSEREATSIQPPLHELVNQANRIVYLVPFERAELTEVSGFRLYFRGLMRTSGLHVAATQLPSDIREMSSDWQTIAAFRSTGAIEHLIFPLFLDALPSTMKSLEQMPFRCVLSDPLTAPEVERLLADLPRDWVHLSVQGDDGKRIWPITTDWREFVARFQKTLESSLTAAAQDGLARIKSAKVGPIAVPGRPLTHKPRPHGLTVMNQAAVMALGAIAEQGVVLKSEKQADYVDAVLASVGEVNEHREWLNSGALAVRFKHRLCIAVPSMLSAYYEVAKNNKLKRERPRLHEVILLLARQKTYTHEVSTDVATSDEMAGYFMEHAREMQTFVCSLSLFSSRTITPVLRIEPRINAIRSKLSVVARMARGTHQHLVFKLNRDARDLMDSMTKAIEPRYLPLITQEAESVTEGIKLVTDLPLEWLPVGNLPLMMAFETSRIPVTPGNLSFDQLSVAKTQTRFLSVSSFEDILIIRSFTDDDPIRGSLEDAIQAVRAKGFISNLRVRFVDVSTPEEFVDAWNSFRGSVLIFDGHGRVDPETGQGQLVIKGRPVTLWDYKEAFSEAPPIVILCACDTHAVDANHTSVGNTMLMLGARTVLGTYLPVQATYASAFIARMLLRIAQYVPEVAAKGFDSQYTWRSVVTGMQRMTFITEVLLALGLNEGIIAHEHASEIGLSANNDINHGDPRWHENFLNNLARLTGKSVGDLLKSISKWASLVDVMHYIQLGNPETLHIVTKEFHEELFPSTNNEGAGLEPQGAVASVAAQA